MQSKAQIRSLAARKRKEQPFFVRFKKDRKIATQLENLPLFQEAKIILFYVSKKPEVDTHRLIKKYLKKKKIIVPTVDPSSNTLRLFELEKWSELKKGAFSILEIKKPKEPIPFPEIDLIIIPGLAFDLKGNRLGYGKGYYDLLLLNFKGPKIALVYELQLFEKIPSEKYDIPVDFIITEEKIIPCPQIP